MTAAASTRSREEVINVVLAQLLRERLGLSTAAETMRGHARPDIVVRRPEGPVVLEVEFEPAATVDADALARLGLEIDGQPVQTAFAVTVPARLRAISQEYLHERLAGAGLTWREWRIDGASGPNLSGGVTELGNAAARAAPPTSNLEEAVEVLDEGVRRAGSRLYSSPGTLARVAEIFNAPPGDEAGPVDRPLGTGPQLGQLPVRAREPASGRLPADVLLRALVHGARESAPGQRSGHAGGARERLRGCGPATGRSCCRRPRPGGSVPVCWIFR